MNRSLSLSLSLSYAQIAVTADHSSNQPSIHQVTMNHHMSRQSLGWFCLVGGFFFGISRRQGPTSPSKTRARLRRADGQWRTPSHLDGRGQRWQKFVYVWPLWPPDLSRLVVLLAVVLSAHARKPEGQPSRGSQRFQSSARGGRMRKEPGCISGGSSMPEKRHSCEHV